jgi:hypothetical protein
MNGRNCPLLSVRSSVIELFMMTAPEMKAIISAMIERGDWLVHCDASHRQC